jgi:hypothetical protein
MTTNDNQKRATLENTKRRLRDLTETTMNTISEALEHKSTDNEEHARDRHSSIVALRAQLIQVATRAKNLAIELDDVKTVDMIDTFLDNMPQLDALDAYEVASAEEQIEEMSTKSRDEERQARAVNRLLMPEIDRQLMQAFPQKERGEYALFQVTIEERKQLNDPDLGRGESVAVSIELLREADQNELMDLLDSEEASKQLGKTYAPDIVALLTWGKAQAVDPETREPIDEPLHARTLLIAHPYGMEVFARVDNDTDWETPLHNTIADDEGTLDAVLDVMKGKYGKLAEHFATFFIRTAVAGNKLGDNDPDN